jgi:hypothetical protein
MNLAALFICNCFLPLKTAAVFGYWLLATAFLPFINLFITN